MCVIFFFFKEEDGIRFYKVTGVQTCALPICDPFARLAIAPAGTFTIVAGSTWPADEGVVLPAFVDLLAQVPTARLVLAPHEPNPDHLAGISQLAARPRLPRPRRPPPPEPTATAPATRVHPA